MGNTPADVMSVSTLDSTSRKKSATLLIAEGPTLQPQDKDRLVQLLLDFHHALCSRMGNEVRLIWLGWTLIQVMLHLNTSILKLPLCSKEEISRQLLQIQEQGVALGQAQ